MKGVALKEVEPGMIVGKSVIVNTKSGSNIIVTVPGTVLTEKLIRKLELFNVKLIFIKSDLKAKIPDKEAEALYKTGHTYIQQVIKSAKSDTPVFSVDYLVNYASDLIELIKKSQHAFLRIAGVKGIDDYVSYHSIDVAIYSIMLGLNMRLTETELLQLAIGAMIHDIGMARISPEIVNKNGKLTSEEYSLVKQHIDISSEIKRVYPDMGLNAPTIIAQHHERWNGKGYGAHLKGKAINNLARIVAVADVYDAITSDRVYKQGQLPHIAAEYILSYAFTDFDPTMAVTFANKVIAYPVGSTLLLSSGEIGTVIGLNSDNNLRPKVEIFMDKTNNTLKENYTVDLAKNLSVTIEDVID